MSDAEDEPFDKEAEREKLRQQLAEEEQAREATQHMSELLLKGATMTSRHCGECGDPIFRHDGREFCPTCGRQAAGGDGAGGASVAAEAGGQTTDDGNPTTTGEGAPPSPEAGDASAEASTQSQQLAASQSPQPGSTPSGTADLPAAREALARKVTALAQEAEATGDVGRARELLAAVREGAEALRALEGQR
jgi:uncharacterized Zn finger protein (UPF0148 family)